MNSKIKVISLLLFSFFLISSPANLWGKHELTIPGSPADGILQSKHNLSINAVEQPNSGFIEVCYYCHTPHEELSSSPGSLWTTSTPLSQKTYGTTIAGTYVPGVSGSSLACLACHDGVTTTNRLINSPSQGNIIQDTTMQSMGLFLTGVDINSLEDAKRLIVNDLRTEHPVSIEYNPRVASLRDPTTIISSIDLNIRNSSGQLIEQTLVQGNLWSVMGAISDTATIRDILKSGEFGSGTGNYVQCATCHDPHYKNQTNPEKWFVSTYLGDRFNPSIDQHTDPDVNGLFLRRVGGNSDSGVCRTCHNKQ
jgi:hypothetical protein